MLKTKVRSQFRHLQQRMNFTEICSVYRYILVYRILHNKCTGAFGGVWVRFSAFERCFQIENGEILRELCFKKVIPTVLKLWGGCLLGVHVYYTEYGMLKGGLHTVKKHRCFRLSGTDHNLRHGGGGGFNLDS